MEIEKLLQKGEKIMLKIKHNGKYYIKVIIKDNSIKYYEVLENSIKQVEDNHLLEHFKNMYETQESDIIYK